MNELASRFGYYYTVGRRGDGKIFKHKLSFPQEDTVYYLPSFEIPGFFFINMAIRPPLKVKLDV